MKMTENNIQDAFAGESQAHMKYQIFADRAERDGFDNVARLFRAISFAERVHAENHLRSLNGIGATAENLAAALEGETFEVTEMYPAYEVVAQLQEAKQALRNIQGALAAEKEHMQFYQDAKTSVEDGSDVELDTVQVCEICGYTLEGEAPDRCPICNARKEKFQAF